MTMKRGIIIACLIGLGAAISVQAETNAPPKPPREGRPMGNRPNMDNLLAPPVLDELALTADQKAKYDTLAADFKKDVAKWRAAHEASENGPSAEARQAMRDLRKSYIDKLRASLTEDQKAKLEKAQERMRARGQRGPGGPGGPGGAPPPPPPPPPPSDK
jgi:Spy/CpxP family protein refolding chaperone